MKLVISEVGVVEIERAARTECGDIQIFSKNQFKNLWRRTIYPVHSAYIVDDDDGVWTLVADIIVPNDCEIYIDDLMCFCIENQEDVYKLNAFL